MLDLNDLSSQIISGVTKVHPDGIYINNVSDTKFIQYDHMSLKTNMR